VHIHEDLRDNNGGVDDDQHTDNGVQRWTSAFQQARRTTTTPAVYIHRVTPVQFLRSTSMLACFRPWGGASYGRSLLLW